MSKEKIFFMSVAEVADRLNLTRSRINQLIKDEVLPARRIGRSYVVDEQDLTLAENRNTKKTGRPSKMKNNEKHQ